MGAAVPTSECVALTQNETRIMKKQLRKIPDALEAEGVSLGESPRDQHVRMLQAERQRVLVREIHVGFVQNHHPFLRVAKLVQLCRALDCDMGGLFDGKVRLRRRSEKR